MDDVTIIAVHFLLIILSIVIHEISHGYVANWLGDPTARVAGRLSLNPLKHIDPIGSVLLPALLIISGSGIMFGWAKPVPVNPDNFKDPRFDNVKVALAGPIANFALAVVAAVVARVLVANQIGTGLEWLVTLVQINLVLGFFNLIPFPPLDGSKLLSVLLPGQLGEQLEQLNPFVAFILLLLLVNSGIVSTWLAQVVGIASQFLLG